MKQLWNYLKNFLDFLKRLPFGKFWFPVGIHAPHNEESLIIRGEEQAVPRSNPIWREQWRWIILKPLHSAPFRIYFETHTMMFCMRYFKKIRTPYVAMRVGPDDVIVKALSDIGCGFDPVELDVFIETATRREIERILTKRMISHQVTWI